MEPATAGVHKVFWQEKKQHRSQQFSTQHKKTAQRTQRFCYRCGSDLHLADRCSHRNSTCSYRRKEGHLERVCRKKKERPKGVNHMDTSHLDDDDSGEIVPMFIVRNNGSSISPYLIKVLVNDVPIEMEIDTGSGISIVNLCEYEKLGGVVSALAKPTIRLRGVSNAEIQCLGEIAMDVDISGSTQPVLLRVVDNAGPSLLGRDIVEEFKLPWSEVFSVEKEIDETIDRVKCREDIIAQFPELFDNSTIGKLRSTRVNLRVDPPSQCL